jgi:type I restriction enzyme, S subunit
MKKDWEVKKLGEIIKLEYGKPLPKEKRKPDGEYPVYGANGEKNRTDHYYYDKKSIIVGRKGSAGAINLTEEKFWPLDVTYYVVIDEEFYDLMFIYYLLSSLDLPKLAKGVKPGINRNEVYSIDVKVPPLSEQQLIVKHIEEALVAIDRAKENTEKNLQNTKDIFESFLQNIFANPGEDWKRVNIEDVCESIIDCINKTAPTVEVPTPFKMIRTSNVKNGQVNLDSVKFVTEDTFKLWTRRQIPIHGDVLLTREAPLGQVGMIQTDDHVFLGQRIVSYRVNSSMLNNRYLLYAFQSYDLQQQIQSLASGSTVKHMRVPDSKKLQLYIPPLQEQQRIIEKIKNLLAETKKLEEIYQQKMTNLDELKKSILQKALNGEL